MPRWPGNVIDTNAFPFSHQRQTHKNCAGQGLESSESGGENSTNDEGTDMLKFIGGTVGIIFIIGLLVVIGILALIF